MGCNIRPCNRYLSLDDYVFVYNLRGKRRNNDDDAIK